MLQIYFFNIISYFKFKKVNYNELLVIKTNTCDTSLRLYRLPLTFTLSLQLKMLIKANYNQQMYSTSHSTIYYVIKSKDF